MKILLSILFLLSVAYPLSKEIKLYPSEWHSLMNITDWKPEKITEKFQIYTYKIDSFPIPAIKIEISMDASQKNIMDVIWDVNSYPKNLPSGHISESGEKINTNLTHKTAWQIIDFPFLDPRYYEFELIKGDNRIDWFNTDTSIVTEKKMIISPVNIGSWIISQKENGYMLTYILLTDPGGTVPSWIVKKAQLRILPKILIEVESAAKKLNANLLYEK